MIIDRRRANAYPPLSQIMTLTSYYADHGAAPPPPQSAMGITTLGHLTDRPRPVKYVACLPLDFSSATYVGLRYIPPPPQKQDNYDPWHLSFI